MIAPPLKSQVQQVQSSQGKPIFPLSSSPSRCRSCKFYQFQGSRGGNCQKLGVLVHGHWLACALALSPFALSLQLGQKITWE